MMTDNVATGNTEVLKNAAAQFHRGNFYEAEKLCRSVLASSPTHPDALHLLGLVAFQAGVAAEAERLVKIAIDAKPGYFAFYHSLARILKSVGRVEESRRALMTALELNRNFSEAWNSLGNLMLEEGKLDQAAAALRKAIECQPRFAEASNNLAIALQRLGQTDEAAAAYRQALAIDPRLYPAQLNLAKLLDSRGKVDDAIKAFGQAAAMRPKDLGALLPLARLLSGSGKQAEAIALFRRACEIRPDLANARNDLAAALAESGDLESAIAEYRRAIELDPKDPLILCNLANALSDSGNVEEARQVFGRSQDAASAANASTLYHLGTSLMAFGEVETAAAILQRCVALKPAGFEAATMLGLASQRLLQLAAAEESYQKAIAAHPSYVPAHLNLANVRLLQGRFDEAWPEYPWRNLVSDRLIEINTAQTLVPAPVPDLSKEEPGRSVLLAGEQGLGDILFFLRFAPILKSRGMELAFRGDSRLRAMLQRTGLFSTWVEPEQPPPAGATVLPVGDLPLAIGAEWRELLGAPLPLIPAPDRLEQMRNRLGALGQPPFIGISWRAGRSSELARSNRIERVPVSKSVPLEVLAQALNGTHGTFISAQRNPEPGETETLARLLNHEVHDLSECNADLEDMLALMTLLDEYVAVSNTNTHLRAGSKKSSLVLVPQPPEWRWLASGDRSPWFPANAIFRQRLDGDWTEALTKLRADLQQSLFQRKGD